MGYDANPNGSDLSIVTVVLQYSVFARDYAAQVKKGYPSQKTWMTTHQIREIGGAS